MAHFTSFDGTSLYYDDQGDGTPVVLLHGFVGDMNIDWVRSGILDRLLDEGYRVISYDARGHGLSDKPHGVEAYANDALTKDTAALLDALGIDSCLLVGFSMGARTALHLSTIDDRVKGVAALGLGELSLEPPLDGIALVPDAMRADDPASIEHAAIRHFRVMADAIRADREALADLMAAPRSEIPAFVDEITVPVLIVTGTDDITAGSPHALAARIANATAVATPGDHAGVKDQPGTQAAIVEFLALP